MCERFERIERGIGRRVIFHIDPDEDIVLGCGVDDALEFLAKDVFAEVEAQLRGFHGETGIEIRAGNIASQRPRRRRPDDARVVTV